MGVLIVLGMKKLLLPIALIIFSCSAEDSCESAPILTTNEAENITFVSATISGAITPPTCNYDFVSQGIVYGDKRNPNEQDNLIETSGTSFTVSITNLSPNTTYYFRTFFKYDEGRSSYFDDDVSFTTPLGYGQGKERYPDGTATDQNGNSFKWINYGTQNWAIKNAEVVTYRDGTVIPQVTDVKEWNNLTTGAWCYYNNDSSKGKLYNWYAIAGVNDNDPNTPQKVFSPKGWHVPSNGEWETLKYFLIENGYNYDGSTTENKIAKSMSSVTGWSSSVNTGAPGNTQSLNNSSGFKAYPLGSRIHGGDLDWYQFGACTTFWSTTENVGKPTTYAQVRTICSPTINLRESDNNKKDGFSVRFVKD